MLSVFFVLLVNLFSGSSTQPTWHSFNEGLALGTSSDKHILIDFYTDWCSWCKKMDKDTYANEEILKILNKHFVLIKVNAEDEKAMATYREYTVNYRELTSGFGVSGFPSTVFLNSKGEYLTLVPGYLDAQTMKTILEYFHTSSYKSMTFNDFAKNKK